MAEKIIMGRIVQKHDVESNWEKATTFVPKEGEIIVYDKDSTYNYERIKIGDGSTLVSALPFVDDATKASVEAVDSRVDDVSSRVDNVRVLVGDKSVSTQISEAIKNKSDVTHTHDEIYYTESEIDSKLSKKSNTGHTHEAYVNQNAFSNVVVGSTTIAADSTTDSLTLVAGKNITLTPDATNDKVTIAATDTVYTHPTSGVTAGTYKSVTVNEYGHVTGGSNPTTLSGYGITDGATKSELNEVNRLLGDTSVSEQIDEAFDDAIIGLSVSGQTITYTKGDGSTGTITTQDTDTVYTHPGYTAKGSGLYKITVDNTGHISSVVAVTKDDITALGIPGEDTDTTYSAATINTAGLMSAADKIKLNGIATGANKITVDSALSSTSTNPVQNNVVNAALYNLSTLLGDKKVSEQIDNAVSLITPSSIGAAPATHNQSSTTITTGGSEGQICAVNADGTISPNARTISSLGTGAVYSLDGKTLTITTL